MKILLFLKRSAYFIFTLSAVIYGLYFYFIGGKEIALWARYTYKNGDLYLSYAHAGIAFFTTLFLFSLLRGLLSKYLKNVLIRFTSAHKKQHAIIMTFVLRLLYLAQYVGAVLAALYFIKKNYLTVTWIEQVRIILITILVTYIVSGITKILLEKKFQGLVSQKSSSASFLKFGNKVLFIFFWLAGFGYVLGHFGYNLNALFAGAGIGGLAIALAAQKSLTNIFGAITILLNKPFQIGDYININGQEGTVKDIGLTYVTLTDRLGHQVMIPNENIITTSIANFNVRENRRVDFIIGLVYATPLEKVQEGVTIITTLLKTYEEKGKITDDIRVIFDMFNAFSLDIKVTYFSLEDTLQGFHFQKQEINLHIKELFEQAGLQMAFPTTEMIIKNETPVVSKITKK